MKKKMNLIAIVAVVMVAVSSINLVSCTADDEYEDLRFGTLAEELNTRSAENTVPEYSKTLVFNRNTFRLIDYHYNNTSYSGNVLFRLNIYKMTKVKDPSIFYYNASVSCNEERFRPSVMEVMPTSAKILIEIKNPAYTVDTLSIPEYLFVENFYIDEHSEHVIL